MTERADANKNSSEEDFKATGMTHLNAVSGANVAIVLGVVLFVVRCELVSGSTSRSVRRGLDSPPVTVLGQRLSTH